MRCTQTFRTRSSSLKHPGHVSLDLESAFAELSCVGRHLYNYALAGTGETVKDHQQGHPQAAPDTQAMIKRDPILPITTYEIAIPAAALSSATGMTRFSAGHAFGVGIAVRASSQQQRALSVCHGCHGCHGCYVSEGTLRCLTNLRTIWGR